jgi:hypothetical protein
MSIQEVLVTRRDTAKLNQWLTESGYFYGVCPPHSQQQMQNGGGDGNRERIVDGNKGQTRDEDGDRGGDT